MSGPVPKRTEERRRRNKTLPVDRVVSDGQVRGPKLTGTHTAVARRWYEALRRSGQTVFYEPSDWAAAELVVLAIDSFVKKPTALMLSSVMSAMTALLVTEGDRRRLRVELEREPEAAEATISVLPTYQAG